MFTQIRDLDKLILQELDANSLLTLCKIGNGYIQSICTDDVFLKRVRKKFPRLSNLSWKQLSWRQYYFYLIHWTSKLEEEFNFLSNDLRDDPKVYYNIISTNTTTKEMKNYFAEGVLTSHMKLIFTIFLYDAAQIGLIDLIQFSIDNGADNIQGAMDMAAYGGNFEAFNYFKKLGANDYQEALYNAKEGKNEDMIEYITILKNSM